MSHFTAAKESPSPPSDNNVSLRPLVEEDLPTTLAIEQASFPSPWTQASFLHELRSPYSRLIAAEWHGQVIGYLCAWLIADELQILDVAVDPAHRRRGVGKHLLQYILIEGQRGGARSASLEVRKSNAPAIALY